MANYQKQLLDELKEHLTNGTMHSKMVDTLNLSKDPVYRRINGEIPLSLEEAHALSKAFNMTLSEALADQESIAFRKGPIWDTDFHFTDSPVNLLLIAGDLSLFQQLLFPACTAFSRYFEDRVFNATEYMFSFSKYEVNVPKEVRRAYYKSNSIELYSPKLFSRLVSQLKFALKQNWIYPQEANKIFEEMRTFLKAKIEEAETKRKVNPRHPFFIGGEVELLNRDIFPGSDCLLIEQVGLPAIATVIGAGGDPYSTKNQTVTSFIRERINASVQFARSNHEANALLVQEFEKKLEMLRQF